MSYELLYIQLQLLTLAYDYEQVQNRKRKRRYWELPVIRERKAGKGLYTNLFFELRSNRNPSYCHFEYFRMSRQTFDFIFGNMKQRIQKCDTHLRKAIPVRLRLAVTLHFLAEGSSFTSIKYHWRIGKSTACNIISETCQAIWEELMPSYLNPPATLEDWLLISEQYNEKWNFPHYLGAIDGKHVRIQCPANAGSQYYNYKSFHSINLMAICSADLKFQVIDIGQSGRWSDSGVFEAGAFGHALSNGQIDLPPPSIVDGFPLPLPYSFVADEAFSLKTWLLRPYPGRNITNNQRIYNFRLSRARRTIESAFGVLTSRWRLLQNPIISHPDCAVMFVQAVCSAQRTSRS